MKLFITGAAGFVGAAVARAALRAGHAVIVAIRPGRRPERIADLIEQLKVVAVDLRDTASVRLAIEQSRPDVIIHVAWAGVGNKDRFDRLQISDNIATTCALVDAGVEYGARKFVGIGSQGEYGPLNRKISEQDLPRPTTLYGAAKLSAYHLTKQLADQGNLAHAWLRLFSTYGPHDNEGWLITMLITEMLAGRRPKCTLGTQFWDYLYIDDLAEGILAASTNLEANGLFNIGSGRPVPVRHIVETIRDLAAPDMELVFGEVPFRPDQVMHMEADIGMLTGATGWAPAVDIETGLKRTVDWHRLERDRR